MRYDKLCLLQEMENDSQHLGGEKNEHIVQLWISINILYNCQPSNPSFILYSFSIYPPTLIFFFYKCNFISLFFLI